MPIPTRSSPTASATTNGQLLAQTLGRWQLRRRRQPDPAVDGSRHPIALADNPLSSLVQAAPGERILIRFANLGFIEPHDRVPRPVEVDVLGRDARYVPPTAQRKATDSIQIGPGESRDVFFTAPAAGRYAFYDRGMSHYGGSADGTDAWVGGQRSEILVVDDLGPQLKPNGWAGEAAWAGEFPVPAVHNKPTFANLVGNKVTGGPQAGRGRFISGQIFHDTQQPRRHDHRRLVGAGQLGPRQQQPGVELPDNDRPATQRVHQRQSRHGNRKRSTNVLVPGPDSSGVYSTPVSKLI